MLTPAYRACEMCAQRWCPDSLSVWRYITVPGAAPPLAVRQIGAAQHDVARWGVGKHLAPAEIGAGVLQAAGENDKRGGQQRFRHLAVKIRRFTSKIPLQTFSWLSVRCSSVLWSADG